jgi:hypothetical protein
MLVLNSRNSDWRRGVRGELVGRKSALPRHVKSLAHLVPESLQGIRRSGLGRAVPESGKDGIANGVAAPNVVFTHSSPAPHGISM